MMEPATCTPATTTQQQQQRQQQPLRDYDELEGVLLPTATPVDLLVSSDDHHQQPSSSQSTVTTTAMAYPSSRGLPQHQQQQHQQSSFLSQQQQQQDFLEELDEREALLLPPVPTDDRYRRRGSDERLRVAQYKGRLESEKEHGTVLRNNQNIHAYNNQMDLELDRANQVAVLENLNEQRLRTPRIAAPPLDHTNNNNSTHNSTISGHKHTNSRNSATKQAEEETPYFQKSSQGGYQIKDYEIDEYNYNDSDYQYDMSEYKSDYD